MTLVKIGNKVVNWDLVACTYLVPNVDRVHIYFQSYQDIPNFDDEPVYKRRPDWILIGEPAKELREWLLSDQHISKTIIDPHDQ